MFRLVLLTILVCGKKVQPTYVRKQSILARLHDPGTYNIVAVQLRSLWLTPGPRLFSSIIS